MTKFVFDGTAFEHYCQWALQDVKTFNKIRDLLKDIKRNPFKGIGNPEPLKHHQKGSWSRRIDKKNRLINKVTSNEIHIAS
ncbi:MAG: Txe/YoeB family addiction module toxin [Bacteroidetes bacterium SW_11_45_7]|nr:MAG: Txe/YoeB family addiction module toxin [Bacteroidetes bacterium SW_11_45_7]